jgi:exosortase A-associated hydrolase 1
MPFARWRDALNGATLAGMISETALTFTCEGETLVGVLAHPVAEARVGMLVLVGGPQYRVGSHRQFLLLARRLAGAGVPVMRFDFRGMGDSSGSKTQFYETVSDIRAALDSFSNACASLEKIILWGLCDAASAALLYWRLTRDSRVAGMVLLNPWVRSEQSLAATHVKHYYSKRLLKREFWVKLANGGVNIGKALRDFCETLATARRVQTDGPQAPDASFQDGMASAVVEFSAPILLILSGQDYTAKEFLEYAASNTRWRGLLTRNNIERADVQRADHTFSTAAWRSAVEELTTDWIVRHFPMSAAHGDASNHDISSAAMQTNESVG